MSHHNKTLGPNTWRMKGDVVRSVFYTDESTPVARTETLQGSSDAPSNMSGTLPWGDCREQPAGLWGPLKSERRCWRRWGAKVGLWTQEPSCLMRSVERAAGHRILFVSLAGLHLRRGTVAPVNSCLSFLYGVNRWSLNKSWVSGALCC